MGIRIKRVPKLPKMGMSIQHKHDMFRNQVTSLIRNDRIQVKWSHAKQLTRYADSIITVAKSGDDSAYYEAEKYLTGQDALEKLFKVLAPRYVDRAGGYTRVVQCRTRDEREGAKMAFVEYIDREGELFAAEPSEERTYILEKPDNHKKLQDHIKQMELAERKARIEALEKKTNELKLLQKARLQAKEYKTTNSRSAKLAK
eukprot:256026_1